MIAFSGEVCGGRGERHSLEDVWVTELVHQLHLFQHVGPVGGAQVHLQHHYLARGLVHHLQKNTRSNRGKQKC